MNKPHHVNAVLRFIRYAALVPSLVTSLLACSGSGGGGGVGGGGADGGAGVNECSNVPSCASIHFDAQGLGAHVVGNIVEVGPYPGAQMGCGPETKIRLVEEGTGAELIVYYALAGVTLPLAVGDSIAIEENFFAGDIDPPSTMTTITKGGELLAYVGKDTGQGLVLPDGLSVANDEAVTCHTQDESCSSEGHALNVTLNGATVKMNVGESATMGDYQVLLRANERLIDEGACDSGSLSRVIVVLPAR